MIAASARLPREFARNFVRAVQSVGAVWGAGIGAWICFGVLSSTAALMNINGSQNNIGMTLSLYPSKRLRSAC